MPSINEQIFRLESGLEDAANMVLETVPGTKEREEALAIYREGSKEAAAILTALDPSWTDPLESRLYAEDLGRRARASRESGR